MASETTMTWEIREGHVLTLLQAMPSESVHCVVTSPPYWNLRNYKVEGQIGLEKTLEGYISVMVEVFREVKRVLRKDGTCWINLGSSFCSGIIESQSYIIRRDLSHEKRTQVLQALSQVWSGNVSPESAMQVLLAQDMGSTAKLLEPNMSEMPEKLCDPQNPGRAGTREVLLSKLCEIGQSDAKTDSKDVELPCLSQKVSTSSFGNQETQVSSSILQQKVLDLSQSAGESLPLERRPTRTLKSRGSQVAQNDLTEGQVSLPTLPCTFQTGSAPYPSVRNPQDSKMGHQQRVDAVSAMPQEDSPSRVGCRGTPSIHRLCSLMGLENVVFPKPAIPSEFLPFCEPESLWKPKDLIDIPHLVIEALRQDGWWLRSDIIWAKRNCMPESVTDRPTRSHEYVFLLTKSSRYFYDAEAVRTKTVGNAHDQYARISRKRFPTALVNGIRKEGFYPMANLRTVWWIATQPTKDCHFATFPEKLVEPCIRAGTSERGCCTKCGVPWEREVEHTNTVMRLSQRAHEKRAAGLRTALHGTQVSPATTTTTGWHPTCSDCKLCDTMDANQQEGIHAIQGQEESESVLEATVCHQTQEQSSLSGKDEATQAEVSQGMRVVQQSLQGKIMHQPILQSDLFSEMDVEKRKGESFSQSLHPLSDTRTVHRSISPHASNGDETRGDLRTSASDGSTSPSKPSFQRSCPSSQRKSKRQQNRKSGVTDAFGSCPRSLQTGKPHPLTPYPTTPCVVLDPFAGSGTTGVVALKLQRSFLGLELNPSYVEMARKRIGAVMPLFANVSDSRRKQ